MKLMLSNLNNYKILNSLILPNSTLDSNIWYDEMKRYKLIVANQSIRLEFGKDFSIVTLKKNARSLYRLANTGLTVKIDIAMSALFKAHFKMVVCQWKLI